MMYEVILTFGHTTKDGAPVPRERISAATAYLGRLLYRACGGARVWEHGGITGNGAGEPTWERATTLLTYATDVEGWRPALREAAACVAAFLNQDSVLFTVKEVSGTVELVAPRRGLHVPRYDGRAGSRRLPPILQELDGFVLERRDGEYR